MAKFYNNKVLVEYRNKDELEKASLFQRTYGHCGYITIVDTSQFQSTQRHTSGHRKTHGMDICPNREGLSTIRHNCGDRKIQAVDSCVVDIKYDDLLFFVDASMWMWFGYYVDHDLDMYKV